RYDGPELRMPPKGKLPDAIIADFEKWVSLGAPDPRTRLASPERKRAEINITEGSKFWSFQPPKLAPIPRVNDPTWPNNDIDCFVLTKLEAKGLKPAPDADAATLLRCLYFVLIGLPPTPDEIDEFLRDCASAKRQGNSAIRIPQSAIVKVVDRLLASPHFGEPWGGHWLDVARFAESSGGGR